MMTKEQILCCFIGPTTIPVPNASRSVAVSREKFE
jgi:hypothetical protein